MSSFPCWFQLLFTRYKLAQKFLIFVNEIPNLSLISDPTNHIFPTPHENVPQKSSPRQYHIVL